MSTVGWRSTSAHPHPTTELPGCKTSPNMKNFQKFTSTEEHPPKPLQISPTKKMKRNGDATTSPLQKKKKVTDHSNDQITTDKSNFDLSEELMNTNNLVNQLQTQLSDLITKVSSKEIQLKQDEKRLLREMEELKKDKMKELSECEEQIMAIKQKISSSTSVSTRLGKNQMVKLNVGGRIFATNLQTITSVKETFFTGYFSDHFDPKPEDDGAFFIDRPFEQFQLILNYLRGIDIKSKLLDLSDSDLKDFIEEVVYYQITPIYEILPPNHSIIPLVILLFVVLVLRSSLIPIIALQN